MLARLIYTCIILFPGLVFAASVERIITLAPHATELAFAAGLGNKVIAVSDRSDYPPKVKSLPKVANYHGINIEKILALKPDLVITWPAGNPPRELEKLKQMGIHLYASSVETLDDIANQIDTLSQYADDPKIGQTHAAQFRQTLAALKHRYQHVQKVRYFYQLSQKPIITIAQKSWPTEVFSLCGGINVFQAASLPYPQVSLEQVLVAQPEAIFNSRHAVQNVNMWSDWSRIPAVKHGYLWTLNADWLNRPTPRTLKAIQEVCQHFETIRQNH